MRIPFIAGNWKMNKTVKEARALVSEMIDALQQIQGVEIVLCLPFLALSSIAVKLQGTNIGLGAQNLYWEVEGAFTGEISAAMIAEYCQYVIIGHSERRTYFHETDEDVNRKIITALKSSLIPIICVGDTLAENEAGRTAEVVISQVRKGLAGLDVSFISKLVIAYEPVWAIGTGRASTGKEANAVVRDVIRPTLSELYGSDTAQATRVLYGGSVTGTNALEFFHQKEIDGALVGGASLKANEFIQIVQAAVK